MATRALQPKYQLIMEFLLERITSGKLASGSRLPSEAMLVKQFGASRITVGRAMRELQQRGLVDRVAGSGSYVSGGAGARSGSYSFGLLIPDLGETEIFEPICRGIAGAPQASGHILLWGNSDATRLTRADEAQQLGEQYIKRKANGVFFAPLEFEADAEKVNHRILKRFEDANIPVVLLDRRPSWDSERHRPDLAGINNRQAGYVATEHLIRLGRRRIGFVSHHGSVATINQRFAGYRDALRAHGLSGHGLSSNDAQISCFPEDDSEADAAIRITPAQGDVEAFVCLNDRVAARLMHAFLARDVRIPEDVAIIGIDDVSYASLLPVPLTTVRQPCRAIGAAALATMLDRIDHPHLPARDVLLDGELIVRRSCGSVSGPGAFGEFH